MKRHWGSPVEQKPFAGNTNNFETHSRPNFKSWLILKWLKHLNKDSLSFVCGIFTELARGWFSLLVATFVCSIVHNRWLCPNSLDWRLLVEELITNIGIPLDVFFSVWKILCVLKLFRLVCLCKPGYSGGVGYVAVTAGVSIL